MASLAFFHIELTAKILGVALVCEVLALLVLSAGIIGHGGGPDGFEAAPLNPFDIFDNSAAIAVFGAGATGIAIFGAFWSWVGFEMAPNYAEESRDPKRIAKLATYASVIGLGVFYIFCSYMFVSGWGLNGSAKGVNAQFSGEIASAWYPLTDRFVGTGPDDDLRGAGDHELVRLRDGVLQHERPLPVRARPRARAALVAGPDAPDAPEPLHRGAGRRRRSCSCTAWASSSTTRARRRRC